MSIDIETQSGSSSDSDSKDTNSTILIMRQQQRTSQALADIAATSTRRSNSIAIDASTLKEDIIEDTLKKNADLLVKNVIKISEMHLASPTSDERRFSMQEKKAVSLDDEPPSLKGENMVRLKHRGSFIRPPVKSIFRTQSKESTSSEFLQHMVPGRDSLSIGGDVETHTPATTDTSMTTQISGIGKLRFSTNLGVRSLLIDTPMMEPLQPIEAVAFTTVLQECVDCLDLLRYVIPAEIDERWDDRFKTIEEKYGQEEDNLIFREDMDLLPLVPTIAEKLQRERHHAHEVLSSAAQEMIQHRTFDVLESEIDDIVKMQEGERSLEVNCQIWMSQVKQLQELLESDKFNNQEEMKRISELAQRTNAEVDNSIFLNGSRLGYVERWESARLEQQNFIQSKKETELSDELKECEKMERADQIVSEEVRTFLQANIKDLEDEMMMWISQYNEEIERREQEINELKEIIEIQKLAIQDLFTIRDERQVFIDECHEEKERIKREEEYRCQTHRAATLLQKMWRGVMVRRQLGQFKGLWALLKKRKKLAAKARKKKKAEEKKMAANSTTKPLKK